MRHKSKYLLFIIPLIFLFVCIKIERPKYSNDPEYTYLLNSVNNARLWASGHTDHPGTTMQVFGAGVLRIVHFFDFSTDDDLQTAVLKNPDYYVEILNKVLLFLNFLIFIYLGFVVFKYSKNIWLSLIVQLTPFYSGVIIEFLATKVTPELFLSIASVLFLAQLIKYSFDPDKNINKNIILFSLISGFGIATKVNFIPVIIIPLIILPSIRNKLFYFIGTVISFMIFTIPIMSQYNTFYQWITAMLTHKGIYGQGESGFVDTAAYISNIIYLLKFNPVFSIALIISFLLAIILFPFNLFIKKNISVNLKILIAIVIEQVLNILIVAKHMKGYYLFPSFCLVGGNLFFIFVCIKQISNDLSYKLKWQIQFFSLLIILATSLYITPIIKTLISNYKLNRYEHNLCNQLIQKSYSGFTQIYILPFSYNKYSAYMFANDYTKKRHISALKNLYPDTYLWDSRFNQFYDWDGKINFNDLKIKDRNKILFFGIPFDEVAYNKIGNTEFKLNPIYKGTSYAIYKLTLPQNTNIFDLFCDAEILTNDGNSFKTNNESIVLNNGITQSSDKSHSNKYSVKLNESAQYGMTFRINNAKKGDNFNITVWRYPEDNNGFIVASGINSKEFYTSGGFILKTENSGWQQIELKFTLETDLKDNILDIYLWNQGKNNIYFDDLKLIRN